MRLDNITYAVDLTQNKLEFHLLHKLAEKAAQQRPAVIREGRMEDYDKVADRIHYLLNKALAHLTDYVVWDRQALDDPHEPFKNMQTLTWYSQFERGHLPC